MSDVERRETAARDSRFTGSVPELYDRHLVPLFFEPYAIDLAERLTIAGGSHARVLEVAAGTGVATQQLRRRLPSDALLTATDLNAPMLAIARRRLGERGLDVGVEWSEADAGALPFPDASFDAVVCQFGLMFVPDKQLAASEAFRVLRPDGQWLFNVWGPLDEHPITNVGDMAIRSFFEVDPPDFYRTPFGIDDPVLLRALAEDAGFRDVAVDDVRLVAESDSADDVAVGFVQGTPVAAAIRERGVSVEAVTLRVAEELAREFGNHPIRAPMLARVVSARKPGRVL
jgi:SAM-dependent methyltransferase